MWRCLNDIWGYCKGEPHFKVEPKGLGTDPNGLHDGVCSSSPATCRKYLRFGQVTSEVKVSKRAKS